MKRVAASLAFAALCMTAAAQPYVPTSFAKCGTATRTMLEPGMPGYPSSREEFAKLLKDALEHCPAGVTEQPRNGAGRMDLAHALAMSGDAAGAARETKAAAELGWHDAPVLLGALHARGEGVPRDLALALEIFRKADRDQRSLASYNLGVLLANGDGVPRDYAEAFTYYRRAAGRKDVAAMLRVAQSYADGRGVAPNRAEAEAWWRRAAEALFVEGRDHPARLREREPLDPAQGLEWFRARAEAGEPWAQAFLGMLYDRGVWVRQDFATAQLWYRKAAEQEYAPAEMRMSQLHLYGRGVPPDRTEASRWGNRQVSRQCEQQSRAAPSPTECDRLAGDPYDPEKAGPGMMTYCLPPLAERAVTACRAALKSQPQSARLRGQLARALLHTSDYANGRKEAEAAARAGSTAAMALLATLHEYGYYDVPKNPALALDWYRKAADRGDERAMNHVFRLYAARGDKDTPELRAIQDRLMEAGRKRAEAMVVAHSLENRANAGDAAAQHNLAARYEMTQPGVAPDYAEALKWYRKAAAQGHGPSIYNLAQMYEKGIGVPADLAEAAALYRKGAESGPGESRLRLAMVEVQRANYAEAHKWLNRAAADGDTRAMIELALLYEKGIGVARDMAHAKKWLERAAPQSAWAAFKVGTIYLEERNYPEAVKWMRISAERENASAMNNLAVMQERGLGMPRDEVAATEMYFRAAQRGSPEARATLNAMYEEGRGEPRGRAERIAWYRRGADLALPSARFKLGQLYEEIGPGQDFAEAMKWYSMTEYDPRAYRAMARLYGLGLGIPAEDADPVKRAYIVQLLLAQAEKMPARKVQRAGFALDPGPDPQRTMQVRIANTGMAYAAAADMGWFDVLRPWRPAAAK